jgi:purine nucleosidase
MGWPRSSARAGRAVPERDAGTGIVTAVSVGEDQAVALPVFADVDTGVDDAMALVYLLASSDANLVGIASTGGNVAVDQVCRNNLGLLELCRAGAIPVSRGADRPLSTAMRTAEDTHGPAGLGYAELPTHQRELTEYDSAEAWVRAAHALPGELIGLVTGPLTNLALAVRDEPNLPSLLRRLVIMGGSFDYRGNTTPVAEWNISVDPEAAAEVFDAWGRAADAKVIQSHQLPIVCGLNLTENIMLTPTILSRLAAASGATTTAMSVLDSRGTRSTADNSLIRGLEDAMRFYFEFHFDQGEGFLAHLHDPLAAAVALDPGLVQTRASTVDVELTGTLTRGMTIADWSGRWGRESNAHVGVGVDPAAFFDRFIERVGPFARRLEAAI